MSLRKLNATEWEVSQDDGEYLWTLEIEVTKQGLKVDDGQESDTIPWSALSAAREELGLPEWTDEEMASWLRTQGVDLEAIRKLPIAGADYVEIVISEGRGSSLTLDASWLKRLVALDVDPPMSPSITDEQGVAWAEANGYIKTVQQEAKESGASETHCANCNVTITLWRPYERDEEEFCDKYCWLEWLNKGGSEAVHCNTEGRGGEDDGES